MITAATQRHQTNRMNKQKQVCQIKQNINENLALQLIMIVIFIYDKLQIVMFTVQGHDLQIYHVCGKN